MVVSAIHILALNSTSPSTPRVEHNNFSFPKNNEMFFILFSVTTFLFSCYNISLSLHGVHDAHLVEHAILQAGGLLDISLRASVLWACRLYHGWGLSRG
jgi:hypothetical protein